jgi:hypothetical protein
VKSWMTGINDPGYNGNQRKSPGDEVRDVA